MKRCTLIVVVMSLLGLLRPGSAGAVFAIPGGIGDALIFQAILVSGVDTLLAIESFDVATAVHKVRFRDGTTGAPVLAFELCLIPGETFTASVFRDGSVTRILSPAMHRINGVLTQLNTVLAGNPTTAIGEVIGLRATTTASTDTAICTNPSIGDDVSDIALMGKAYYVNGASAPPLLYGASAVAFQAFADVKISDGTVFGNEDVAEALIFQGSIDGSQFFGARYFVPASFGAVTQVVLSFPTGPNSVSCPSCRVPSSLSIFPQAESGASLPTITLPGSTSLVRVISLTSSDIASDSGILTIFETFVAVSIPLVGFGINTTAPGAPLFFNALFPLGID